MKRVRFTEEQIIAILREQEAGADDGGGVPQARDQQRDLLQVEGQVWRSGGVGRAAAEGAGGRERQAEEAAGRGDARQRHAEGRRFKKMVTPAARREAVAHLCATLRGERAAGVCGDRGRSDIGALSQRRRPDDAAVAHRGCASWRRCAAGSAIAVCTSLLRREGMLMNHKKLRRLYREERLQVRRRGGRKRALGTRAPMAMPQGPNQRWSLDFVSDALTDGRRFRILAVVDDFTRECLALVADTSLSGLRVARELDAVIASRGRPTMMRLRQRHRADQHGDPALVAGAPGRVALHRARQAAAERLHRELQRPAARRAAERDAVHVARLTLAKLLADWKDDYNTVRPHSALGNLAPIDLCQARSAPDMQRDGALRYVEGSAPRPVAPPSHTGSNDQQDSTHHWMKEGAQVIGKQH